MRAPTTLPCALLLLTLAPHAPAEEGSVGDAWSDARNPVRVAFGGERLDLWSLRPVVKAKPPAPADAVWGRGPIDAFVGARLEAAGLSPAPEADRWTLGRRLHFDLTGLPPEADALEAFAADPAPDAVERLVDRLLASRAFAEHWARWWLDAARYSDSNGFDWDEWRPQAWRYRDYVVRSLAADKPFDQFITEQLAGDESLAGPPRDAAEQDRLIATGFLRVGPWDNSSKLFREEHKNLAAHRADLAETVGTVLLGMTMSCCRCHDHKTEPLTQADHYRLRAFFAGVEAGDDVPIDLLAEREAIEAHNRAVDAEEPDAEKARARHRPFTTALVVKPAAGGPAPTHILRAGDADHPEAEVAPGVPSVFDPGALPPAEVASGDGRRTALARWLVSGGNPLTARVLANRIWQGMTGRGIVATPGDFGLSGARPSHPELLDWLAADFVEGGWSLKRAVRAIALSSTYRQQAYVADPEARRRGETADPDNALLWRMNPRRLTAEQLRDAMLAVSGELRESDGGPPVWPELPESVLAANPAFFDDNAEKTKGWYPSAPEQLGVRSLYLIQKRSVQLPFLATFDQPDNFASCTRRGVSTSAPQAFALLNNPEAVRCARALARRAEATAPGDPEAAARAAWRLALARDPSPEEWAAASGLRAEGLDAFCRALLNLNAFAYVD